MSLCSRSYPTFFSIISLDVLSPSLHNLCFPFSHHFSVYITRSTQPPIELLRQWMDYDSWYNRTTLAHKTILDTQLVAAMGPPGGAREQVTRRFLSRLNVINVTFPEEAQIKRIFETIINDHFQTFEEEVKQLGEAVARGTSKFA